MSQQASNTSASASNWLVQSRTHNGARVMWLVLMCDQQHSAALFTLSDDAREGQKAFQEKRKPNWTGR